VKAAFGDDELRRARKRHQCEWCFDFIEPGDTYLRWFGMNEECDVNHYKMHHECRDAINREHYPSYGESHRRGMTLAETEDSS
jgi:hypothetical protein